MSSETSYEYDLVTIGGGSGGVRASRTAAVAGAKVALIELPFNNISSATTGGLGGTCVLRGCVPKKLLMYGSQFTAEFEDSVAFGYPDAAALAGEKVDWDVLVGEKNKEIARLNGVYSKLLSGAGVEVFEGIGRMKDAHTVELEQSDGSKRTMTAKNILVATGGVASKLDIPGAEFGITSDEALSLDKLPEKIVVIGGGYIAVEFAGIFKGLGSEVHLVFRQGLPLRGFDEEVRSTVMDNLQKRGIHVHHTTNPTKITKSGSSLTLDLDTGLSIDGLDAAMFATGRKPNIHRPDVGVGALGLELTSAGAIKVDELSRTSVESVWAVGDVTNRMNLTPVALMEGMAFTSSAIKDEPKSPDYDFIPSAVFCQPPAATVGITEADALSKGITADVYVASFKPMRGTLSKRDEKTLMKLIVDVKTDKVLGMHMVGPDSAEIMQGMAVALKCGCTKKILDSTVGIHPSAAEEFVTMRTPTRRIGPVSQL
mmetsp:Transcript_31804/g.38458  ORF Transcript_31804/g.38458 Transcript_31804/m.38458 type:complete len:484 (+) Transcript_31804:198-1649(+)|eukprot:CAMPEP_0197850386 /NCGR_PEP_ID=MMETSP1438-20131217/15276_1 /TAXON_ID=1461541 /ORGANISM="Pterosperma sp., Strain CCMP1384" /LENGTH=483 /DNA_ID=CAMNT_0043463537 /DNA_START=187 /DNA_END=1638 /DNA_ORIENTATION=+